MKRYLTAMLLALVFSSTAFAEKPEWAGKGKPTSEQKEAHRAEMGAKGGIEEEIDENEKKIKKEKIKKEKKIKGEHDELTGLEKQKETKSEQKLKELEQGSEKGKEARQDRKKWWKFWGD